MTVIINETTFHNAEWMPDISSSTGLLTIASDLSITELAQLFDGGNDVEVYDDEDTLISKWKNLGVQSITSKMDDVRKVNTLFKVSILDDAAEEVLQKAIDDGVEGIIELAGLYADIQEDVDKLNENMETVEHDVTNLNSDMTNVKNQISSIPSDISERFTALWNNYNALADRVSKLENE